MSKDYFGEIEEEKSFEPINFRCDLTGKRFGRWIVIKRVKYHYLCECSCGLRGIRDAYSLLSLKSTQCYKCYRKNRECYLESLRIDINEK